MTSYHSSWLSSRWTGYFLLTSFTDLEDPSVPTSSLCWRIWGYSSSPRPLLAPSRCLEGGRCPHKADCLSISAGVGTRTAYGTCGVYVVPRDGPLGVMLQAQHHRLSTKRNLSVQQHYSSRVDAERGDYQCTGQCTSTICLSAQTKDIHECVDACSLCTQSKKPCFPSSVLLCPLPVAQRSLISTDFVNDLSCSEGKTGSLTMLDQLTEVYFITHAAAGNARQHRH